MEGIEGSFLLVDPHEDVLPDYVGKLCGLERLGSEIGRDTSSGLQALPFPVRPTLFGINMGLILYSGFRMPLFYASIEKQAVV